ncbi:hypothetical protein D3C83_09640 [compost metagenome]
MRHHAIRGWIRAAEQGDKADRCAFLQQLSRQLESDDAARAEAGNNVRSVGPECADLGRKVRGMILHACERLAMAVESRRLQPKERLVVPEVVRQSAVTEDVAVMPGHAENGSTVSARLQRNDGTLLLDERLSRTQELQDLVFPLLQLFAQLRSQHAGRSIASQSVAFRPDFDIAAAQL